MLKYYEKDFGQNYVNVIEKAIQFLYDEFMVFMVYIKLFDVSSMSFIKRRVFAYSVCFILVSFLMWCMIASTALIGYIALNVGKL